MTQKITIIGAGLAGSEAAWQLLKRGFAVHMIEMRPIKQTPAHSTDLFGELVCSNSLRSDDAEASAVGLLHQEMRRCDSLIMSCADKTAVPAGGALAVNREEFAKMITDTLKSHPNFTLEIKEADLPLDSSEPVILATGPLTGDKLADELMTLTGTDSMHFFDAIAPIVYTDSVDMSKAWYQSRYDKGDGTDYLNCPLSKDEYNAFIDALLAGEKVDFKEWEKNTPYFEGCLPIEVMAERGRQTLLFGPMKPVGLIDKRVGKEAYAVVQLRKDNQEGTLFNIVGFQTRMKWGEQKRVLQMIPGLEEAEIVRYGVMHRNTFVNGPLVMESTSKIRGQEKVFLAGQITGVEGYVESTACGLVAGINAARLVNGEELVIFPLTTAIGGLMNYITTADSKSFQPMNINFSLIPGLGRKIRNKKEKNGLLAERALADLQEFLPTIQ